MEGVGIEVTDRMFQGSVLEPAFWNVNYDEVIRLKFPEGGGHLRSSQVLQAHLLRVYT